MKTEYKPGDRILFSFNQKKITDVISKIHLGVMGKSFITNKGYTVSEGLIEEINKGIDLANKAQKTDIFGNITEIHLKTEPA